MRIGSDSEQFENVGLAAYFHEPLWRVPGRIEQVSKLLVDPRWPWIPWWARFSAIHKRDDRSSVRVGGKNGAAPLVEGMSSPKLSTLRMDRTLGAGNFSSVALDLGRRGEEQWSEAAFELRIICRSADLPAGRSFESWLTLAHELVSAVGSLHATLGVWPSYYHAVSDTSLAQFVLDTPKGQYLLAPMTEFRDHQRLVSKWRKFLGRTYARHPRWGTYLNAEHVAAIGGVERIRAEVQPARIDAVGDLTYIQLTETVETALTAEGNERRLRLQELMAPILLGAPRPGSPAAPAG